MEIVQVGTWPGARESHSAVVLHNTMVIFGGHNGAATNMDGAMDGTKSQGIFVTVSHSRVCY